MTVSPRQYRRVAIAALFALGAIVVTGAAVRLTNSGLGCSDWPRCSDTRVIDVSSQHAAIEQINRLFTGVVGVAVIVAVLASLRRRPYRRDLVIWSSWLVAGVIANAVLGGISVKVNLHPLAIQGHMVLSMALISAATVLVRRASEPDDGYRVPVTTGATRSLQRAHYVLTWCVVVTGTLVTGAGPHAGDESARRLNLDIGTVARVHSATMWITIAVTLWIAVRVARGAGDRRLANGLTTWIVLGALQGTVGYIQYVAGVPALLVELHVLGATAIMWAATNVLLDRDRCEEVDAVHKESVATS